MAIYVRNISETEIYLYTYNKKEMLALTKFHRYNFTRVYGNFANG